MPAIGLDVLTQRSHFKGHIVHDDRDRSVLDAGRHGVETRFLRPLHHDVRLRGRGHIDVACRQVEQGVANGATDDARFLTVGIERREKFRERPASQPGCALGREERRRFLAAHLIRPGMSLPSSYRAGS